MVPWFQERGGGCASGCTPATVPPSQSPCKHLVGGNAGPWSLSRTGSVLNVKIAGSPQTRRAAAVDVPPAFSKNSCVIPSVLRLHGGRLPRPQRRARNAFAEGEAELDAKCAGTRAPAAAQPWCAHAALLGTTTDFVDHYVGEKASRQQLAKLYDGRAASEDAEAARKPRHYGRPPGRAEVTRAQIAAELSADAASGSLVLGALGSFTTGRVAATAAAAAHASALSYSVVLSTSDRRERPVLALQRPAPRMEPRCTTDEAEHLHRISTDPSIDTRPLEARMGPMPTHVENFPAVKWPPLHPASREPRH
eukprot:NODE_12070_length_1247_cov_9.507143.p1 GENE.NODE_12070_length_1247_cov_9.507143~~NODE_12070_length_1247_cov_9.507143.p1  ORF type:complete len:308 (+),score=64.26 NODE_12070_length_1247_cov_9.507143:69-992(+)